MQERGEGGCGNCILSGLLWLHGKHGEKYIWKVWSLWLFTATPKEDWTNSHPFLLVINLLKQCGEGAVPARSL